MNFSELFHNITVPVLIYENGNMFAVVYGNPSAASLLYPWNGIKICEYLKESIPVNHLLKMPKEDFILLTKLLNQSSKGSEIRTRIRIHSGEYKAVTLSANRIEIAGIPYVKVCIYPQEMRETSENKAQILASVLHAAYEAESADEAIDTILTVLGQSLNLCRICVFEAVSERNISNTYEWCVSNKGMNKRELHTVPRQQLYNLIMGNDCVTTEDGRTFAVGDETVVGSSESQSILSIPIDSKNQPLGYMIVEDCISSRQWSRADVRLLQDVAKMLQCFIKQRDEQENLRCKLAVLHTVSIFLEDIIYVNDLVTKQILFANQALSTAVSIPLHELIGRDSNQVLLKFGRLHAYEYPVNLMVTRDGKIIKRNITWEFHNQNNGRWYLVRSAIIQWIDGRDVQFETLTDITEHKEHETMLEYIASTDMMTGVYNREWGRRLIEYLLKNKGLGQTASLVFLDLDNLKYVNDRFGHSMGDEMITKTVAVIQSCIRKSDFLCRWGGDEFLIVIRANEKDTLQVMQKIQICMDEYNSSRSSLFQLSFSYGVVEINSNTTDTIENLISKADQRMYKNKLKRIKQT